MADRRSIPAGVTEVTVSYTLIGVTNTDRENGFVDVALYEFLSWKDSRLAGQEEAVSMDSIWTPDMVMFNDLNCAPVVNDKVPVAVQPDGTVSLVQPINRRVPFTQENGQLKCNIRIGSWTQSKAKIETVIGQDPVNTEFFTHPKYSVGDIKAEVVERFQGYPMAVFNFSLNA